MIRQNIIANLFGRAWGIVSVYLFIPLYLKFLGIEAYGLVGFYSTLLGVLAFADLGFTATLSREMARLSVRKGAAGVMADLLRTYESIYLLISLTVAFTIWFLAPVIAEHWLRAGTLPPHEIAAAIRLMGISIALQLPSQLYVGGLMGLQRQVLSNSLQIAWGVFRGVGAVLVLWLLSPTILAFASWQLLSNGLYCLVVRWNLWHALSPTESKPQFSSAVLRDTWRYATGMAGMSFFSMLLTQTDKLAVSRMLPLEVFGYYTLAGSLAAAPIILAGPIGIAMFPRMTGLVSRGDRDALTRLYHRACGLISVVALPCALTLALYAGNFIFAWTGSAAAAQKVGVVALLLLCGSSIQSILIVPCYLALAHGHTRLNLQLGIISVVLITPLLILLIVKFGVVGGGISWLVMNLCTLPPYMYFLHRRFLPGELRRWCLRDTGLPLLVALSCGLLGRWLLPSPSSRMATLAMIALVWSVTTAATGLASAELRGELCRQLSRVCCLRRNWTFPSCVLVSKVGSHFLKGNFHDRTTTVFGPGESASPPAPPAGAETHLGDL